MAFGKISGAMLQDNLDRQGLDLQLSSGGLPLIYFNTTQGIIGVANTSPTETLTVSGNLSTSNIKLNNNVISTTTAGQDLYLTPGGNLQLGSINNIKVTGGGPNYIVTTDGNGNLNFQTLTALTTEFTVFGNNVVLGSNTAGALISNATSLTSATSVTNSIAQLNYVLGKLVPPSPPAFPGASSLTLSGLSTARMCNFTQTDNTATQGHNVAGGTTVSTVLYGTTYTTNTFTAVGPGNSGTLSVYLNGTLAGSNTLVGGVNVTNGNLVITNNQDYHNVVSTVTAGFWYSFNTYATGSSIPAGWNEVYMVDTAGSQTNTALWYRDTGSIGTPQYTSSSVSLTSNVVSYSSSIPHLTSSSGVTLNFSVNRLSGDLYPTSDTFVTGTTSGAFTAPASLTYSAAGISTPLARNLYASSGSIALTTTANIITGFGSSSTGPTVNTYNVYGVGTSTISPGVTVLYKTGTTTNIEETSIPVSGSLGGGSGNGYRISGLGNADTPSFTGSESAWNSQTTTLNTYDATVVAAILKNDQTNYSTGYWPVGPNLSSGRSGGQYFTFKFIRTGVSKFNIAWTGPIAGLWIALPGSTINSSSSLNGWLDASVAYAGSGVPGANTGSGGNGSNGCAVGGTATLNTSGSFSITASFGTVSSSSTATNEIYVRVRLNSNQSLTALSIVNPTN
jgi:hypothetical protein